MISIAQEFVDMLADYIAEQIGSAKAPSQHPAMSVAPGMTVEGVPPCMIDVEPAPDAVPVEDEHRLMLGMIRELVASHVALYGIVENLYSVTSICDSVGLNEYTLRDSMKNAESINTRANAILAEQDALDTEPAHGHRGFAEED